MTIHHATVERAKKYGVILSETEDGFAAHWPKLNQRMTGASAKVLLDDMCALIEMKTHYRSYQLVNGETDESTGRGVFCIRVNKVGDFKAPRLQDALEAAIAAWEEYRATLTEDDDDSDAELPDTSSVVSPKYRAKYADLGHANHCGDWLAGVLNNLVANKKGTNVDLFVEICAVNGVDLSKYNRTSPGWQGRIRMTGRNILSRRLYDSKVLLLPEHLGMEPLRVPQEWLDAQRYAKEE